MRFLPEIQMIVQYALATQQVLATPVKPPRIVSNPPPTPIKSKQTEPYSLNDTMKLRAKQVAKELEYA